MTMAPRTAPVKFAKTSKTSAKRVSVNTNCAISITTHKDRENKRLLAT
jgi:hypothetical protein